MKDQERVQMVDRIEKVTDLVNQKRASIQLLKTIEGQTHQEIIQLDNEAEELYTKLFFNNGAKSIRNG